MIPEVLVFAQVAAITVALVGSITTIGWTVFRKAHLLKAMGPLPRQTDAQLEQLQQSVDAIALEVERIAEAQRFSMKMLAERNAAQPDGMARR